VFIFTSFLHFNQIVFKTLMFNKFFWIIIILFFAILYHFYFFTCFLFFYILYYTSITIFENCILFFFRGFNYFTIAIFKRNLIIFFFFFFNRGLYRHWYKWFGDRQICNLCFFICNINHITILKSNFNNTICIFSYNGLSILLIFI
jgi:hypothetical protein